MLEKHIMVTTTWILFHYLPQINNSYYFLLGGKVIAYFLHVILRNAFRKTVCVCRIFLLAKPELKEINCLTQHQKKRSVRIHCFNQTFVTGTDTWQESFLKQKRFALAQVQSFQPCLLGPCLWVWRWRQQDGVTRSCYWGTEINQGPDASFQHTALGMNSLEPGPLRFYPLPKMPPNSKSKRLTHSWRQSKHHVIISE